MVMKAKEKPNKNENLGCYIAQLRKDRNMTQQDLANIMHVSRIAVINWEKGKFHPSNMDLLATALNTSVDDLLNYKPDSHYNTLVIDLESIVKKTRPNNDTTVQRVPDDFFLSSQNRKTIVAMLKPVISYIKALPKE